MNDALLRALSTVNDPELHRDLVSLGMIERAELSGDVAQVKVNLTTPACPLKGQIELDVRSALLQVPGVRDVQIEFGAMVRAATQPALPGVKHVVLVGSGKGGVGKSTTAVNLALALAAEGARVGLLDADIYGPSVPAMLGLAGRPESRDNKTMEPLVGHGLQANSIGLLIDADAPAIWRGPMVTQALEQLLRQTNWRDLDYLVVDMPPGTGDIALTLAQKVPVAGAVIVTTPQDIALLDARKGLRMFQKVHVPILGVVENMAVHICPQCGHAEHIFGAGGGRRVAEQYEVPWLGSLPLQRAIREQTDAGNPTVAAEPDGEVAGIYRDIARRVAARIAALPRDMAGKLPAVVVRPA
ncbi:MAG TPA: iron-sulfur cluster carrier protein ApbC [Deinococcus radiodurans]|nr:iron-sulfur cluster carrier protein ApbC [Deinococcus radiodurans]